MINKKRQIKSYGNNRMQRPVNRSGKYGQFMIWCIMFLLCTGFAAPAAPAAAADDWQETVKRHLGTFMIFDKLVIELRAQFDTIDAADKGAAALIMAYSYNQLKRQEIVAPVIPGFFSKTTAMKYREVSQWFKRYLSEFSGQDHGLMFLSPDREEIRRGILDFAAESKKEFPVISVESDITGSETFIKIKLRVNTSAACGFEIFHRDDKSPLDEGVLQAGLNERIIQIPRSGALKVGQSSFLQLVVFNRFLNEKKVTFQVPALPGEQERPATPGKGKGKEAVRTGAGQERAMDQETMARYKLVKKRALPNLVIGVSLFLLNSQILNHQYKADDVQPFTKADLYGTQKVLDTVTFGLIAKSLAGLLGSPVESAIPGKTHYGLFYTLSAEHSYDLYRQGMKENVQGAAFSESDIAASVLFRGGYESDIFLRRLEASNVMIAGGLWSVRSSILGVNLGKVFTVSDRQRRFLADFSGGAFFARLFNRDYEFLDLQQDEMVKTHGNKISYGLYAKVQLRLDLFKKVTRPKDRLPILALGFKYFFPLNNFEFSRDLDVTYRLQRKFFFIGLYF